MNLHTTLASRLAVLSLLLGFGQSVNAAFDSRLFEFAVNVNGVLTSQAFPSTINAAGFDQTTGLGTISTTVAGPGSRYVGFYVDIEIDQTVNTFFNEYGVLHNTKAAVQTWEIDEPGFTFGNIYGNLSNSALDNSNGVPIQKPDDVAMALAWSLALTPTQTAVISFHINETKPSDGTSKLFLEQTDPDSGASLYFWSDLEIQDLAPIPEPGTALAGILVCLVGAVSQLNRCFRGKRQTNG